MALPDYLEDTAKDFASQATAAYSAPIETTKFTGRQFVAGEDPLQTQAINLARAGVGSYAPFLQAAAAATGQQAADIAGLRGLTGPQAYQPFMSPYQTDVIDETLRQYDQSRIGGRQTIQDAAVTAGAFGGGREGALLGQYDADTLANRAGIRAGLLQQGFNQAQQLAAQRFGQQGNIAQMQGALPGQFANLSNFGRQSMGADIQALGGLGALRQGMTQAQLSADQQAARTAAYEPYGRLQQYGSAITGLSGATPGFQYQDQPVSSPFTTALQTALGVGGLYSKIFG